ncbi:MAG TPA: O-antigen ligase family protein [Gemmatimonadaceae bacterium]|nr:O-antigen ligase family protein [Gemmatimonadaceae bacterium]
MTTTPFLTSVETLPYAYARPAKRHRVKPVLLFFLALLYPFHFNLTRGTPGLAPHQLGASNQFNVSAGDLVVALTGLGIIIRFLFSRVRLPRYAAQGFTLFGIIMTSLLVNTFDAPPYYSARVAVVESTKFLAAMMWMIAVFWLIYEDFHRRFLLFALITVALACGSSAWSVFENIFQGVPRPAGTFSNPNIFANYIILNMTLAVGASSMLAEDRGGEHGFFGRLLRKHRPILLAGAFTLLMLGMLATGSRGGLLALLAAAACLVRLPRGQISIKRVVATLFGVILIGVALTWFLDQHPYVLTRVGSTLSGQGKNIDVRLRLYKAAYEAFISHPVLGVGYGQFGQFWEQTGRLPSRVVHQTYLSAAAELGIVGLLVFLWLLGSVARDAWRARLWPGSRVPRACFAYIVGAAVQGMTNNVDQFRALWIAFGIVAAFVYHIAATEWRAPPAPMSSPREEPRLQYR